MNLQNELQRNTTQEMNFPNRKNQLSEIQFSCLVYE